MGYITWHGADGKGAMITTVRKENKNKNHITSQDTLTLFHQRYIFSTE